MAAALTTPAVTEILFCPFCREAHEGLDRCPEHDLRLVSGLTLARQPRVTADDDIVPWYSPKLARGWLALGAALALLAFLAGSIASIEGEPDMSGRMLELASRSAPRLWLIPVASSMLLALLARRRTPRAMRSARLAALLLAVAPAVVVVWTLLGMEEALSLLRARTRQPLALQAGMGAWVVALATCAMVLGALRLGVLPLRRLPKGDREP